MRLFDRSEPGAWVSGAAHAVLLAAAVAGFAWEAFPEVQEGIPVEVVSDSQFAEMTRGERQADTVQPDLKPRVDRVAETVEERDPGEASAPVPSAPTRPPEMQVAAREVAPPPPPPPPMPPRREVAKVEPPPAPPRREVERKPEAKLEAKPEAKPETTREDVAKVAAREAEAKAKAKAETEARQRAEDALAKAEAKAVAEREKAEAKAEAEREKAAAEAKARAEAEARQRAEEQARERAEAEAKAVQQAKVIAEAKLVAEAKLKAEAKAKAEAEAKAKRLAEVAERFNPGDIRQLLASREPAQATGSTGRELQRTAALGTATGNAQKLNPSQISALEGHLRDQIQNHYMQVPGSKNDAVTNPVMEIRLNPDGSLAAEPRLLKVGPKPIDRAVAEAALRAVRKAAPFRIPAQFAPYYNGWKVLNPEFTPE